MFCLVDAIVEILATKQISAFLFLEIKTWFIVKRIGEADQEAPSDAPAVTKADDVTTAAETVIFQTSQVA